MIGFKNQLNQDNWYLNQDNWYLTLTIKVLTTYIFIF